MKSIFAAITAQPEYKSEYLEGRVYAMAGGRPEHAAITMNIGGELRAQLRGGPCRVYSGDLKVGTPDSRLFAYPDLSVVCGEARFRDERRDVLVNLTLLVEVLSPSTEAHDRGKKFSRYRQIGSLTDYLLVSQDEPFVDHYEIHDGGRWVMVSASGLDGVLELPALGVTFRLSDVYDGIVFPPEEETEAKNGLFHS